eukprot:GHVL01029044.1.p1 GENE.GHVL01029044.1~~GHVL01029044.1.p1  ORF type:complete len:117 (-),score=5.65 GHVL01029044.1:851-1201(-)
MYTVLDLGWKCRLLGVLNGVGIRFAGEPPSGENTSMWPVPQCATSRFPLSSKSMPSAPPSKFPESQKRNCHSLQIHVCSDQQREVSALNAYDACNRVGESCAEPVSWHLREQQAFK